MIFQEKIKPAAWRTAGLLTVAAIVFLLFAWQTAHWTRQRALRGLSERSRYTLNLIVETLRGELSAHQNEPQLLARNPAIIRYLTGSPPESERRAINEELEQVNTVSGAADTYLMNSKGDTVAASNWRLPNTFVGQNFSYRPYFQDAMNGRLGRFFALGTTSGERGYFFAYPVYDGDHLAGCVAVKVRTGQIEAAWRSGDYEVLAADEDGTIFLSSNPPWRLNTLAPLSQDARRRIKETRRYDGAALASLGFRTVEAGGGTFRLVTIDGGSAGKPFLLQEINMPLAGWRVMLLARTGEVDSVVRETLVIEAGVAACLLLVAANVYQRRRRLIERMALQERAKAELEERVHCRTLELSDANAHLLTEVAERRRAEAERLLMQAELIQASKLAALGQMSAGLSHELNQPLAAIRSYSENTRAFLALGQHERVSSNLGAICELTERMARIISHLRTFARKEPVEAGPAPLVAAIDGALALMAPRLKSEQVTVRRQGPGQEILVVGGRVRLEQVFLNLFTNAADAMRAAREKVLEIGIAAAPEHVTITVRDTGSGIESDGLSNIFDPFFTTKEAGQGLGLGLSISYGIIQQFGGAIEASSHPGGGAVFTVRLVRAAVAENIAV